MAIGESTERVPSTNWAIGAEKTATMREEMNESAAERSRPMTHLWTDEKVGQVAKSKGPGS